MNQIAENNFPEQFILIDDDNTVLFMCKVIVKKAIEDVKVVTYNNPQLAVDYFETEFKLNPVETRVMLDINMPELSGWEVLDAFFMLGEEVRKFIKVIMLSSSIHPGDKQRAMDHPCVTNYFEKPFNRTMLVEAMNTHPVEMAE